MHCVSCIGRQILDHWATRESESEVAVVSDSVTPWTVAYQAPQSIEFSRQEYWSGLPFPSSGDLPDPGIEPRSPTLRADTLPSEPSGKPYNSLKPLPKKKYRHPSLPSEILVKQV